jgi:hypothetical protein
VVRPAHEFFVSRPSTLPDSPNRDLGFSFPSDASLLPLVFKRLNIHGSLLSTRSVEYQAVLVDRFKREVLDNFTPNEPGGPPLLELKIWKVR